jgi:hypothetical protein
VARSKDRSAAPDRDQHGATETGTLSCCSSLPHRTIEGIMMADQTKREFWLIALSTLAAAPFIACGGLVVVRGIVAW